MTTGLELVAMGARTPVGLTAAASAAAVRGSLSRLREFSFVTAHGSPVILGTDAKLTDEVEGRQRMWPMLESALDHALGPIGPALAKSRHPCEVLLALPPTRPGFSEDDAQWIRQQAQAWFNQLGIVGRVTISGRGHAGALAAVHQATQRLASNRPTSADPIVCVAGLDSYHHPDTLLWLESERRLALDDVPNGFTPGEAAGCLVLTTQAIRKGLALDCLAVVEGVAITQEALLRTSDSGSLGVAMHEAVTQAGSGLSLPADAADTVYCDINGERYRSEEWGFFAMRGYRAIRSIEYRAPCDSWGDIGAAFGPLAVILAAESFRRGYAKGPRALVMAGSDNGLRGALFLRSPVTDDPSTAQDTGRQRK